MIDSVDEVLGVLAAEGIDAHAVKSGCLRVAVTEAQAARLRSFVAAEQALGGNEPRLAGRGGGGAQHPGQNCRSTCRRLHTSLREGAPCPASRRLGGRVRTARRNDLRGYGCDRHRPRHPAGPTPAKTVEALTDILCRLFPALAGVRIERSWSGVLAVPRDWCAGVGYDPATGLGWAGGDVGQGVTTANLAGRTLADLITGTHSPLTSLPWVGHVSRRWEPEPLRWLGVQAMYGAYRLADRRETEHGLGRSALAGRIADRLSGR